MGLLPCISTSRSQYPSLKDGFSYQVLRKYSLSSSTVTMALFTCNLTHASRLARRRQAREHLLCPVDRLGDRCLQPRGQRQLILVIGHIPPIAKILQASGVGEASLLPQMGAECAVVVLAVLGAEPEISDGVVAGMRDSTPSAATL